MMLQGNIFYSTLLFMLLAFFLMKIKSNRKSYYKLASDTNMSVAPGVRSVGMINSGMTSI